jgi:hypothetical protein
MLNQNNLSYNDYSTIKLEFEKFDFLQDNNRSQNVNKNNRY